MEPKNNEGFELELELIIEELEPKIALGDDDWGGFPGGGPWG
jgi:hypothetical protein